MQLQTVTCVCFVGADCATLVKLPNLEPIAIMAKDKTEKKKKHTSEAAPAAVEDVEMEEKEVSDRFRLGQQVTQDTKESEVTKERGEG